MNQETHQLNMALQSTGMRPHSRSTADKDTPSRITNQAVVVVSRDSQGNMCSITAVPPEIYQKIGRASYTLLATQMVEAIKENFSVEMFPRHLFELLYFKEIQLTT